MKEIKNIVNSDFTSQNVKIASQNQKFFSPVAGYKPRFTREIIVKLLSDDNLNTGDLHSVLYKQVNKNVQCWG